MSGPRGFPPVPTAILEARGSWRAKAREGEPRPPVQAPECPEHLIGEARAEWERQAPELVTMRVLAGVDRAALACFCEAWAEFVACCKEVEQNGRTYAEKGIVRIRPSVKIKNEAAARVLHFAAQFGLTPSARVRLQVIDDAPDDDPLERLLTNRS